MSPMHISKINNLNQIARAKGEIIDNITYDGTMIINMMINIISILKM